MSEHQPWADLDADVVVVGAGPAGIAAALTLHRQGRDVLVVDKATFPRDKTCGDGLTTLALRELDQLGLDPDDVESWTPVGRAVLHSPRRRIVSLPLPGGPGLYGAVARRADLDAALVRLARSAGVRVEESAALIRAEDLGDRVRLEVDRLGAIEAHWVIGADGMWSPLRRSLGLHESGYRGEWHAARQYLRHTGPGTRDLHVWFEPDLLPGYVWSFPLPGGGANVGFGLMRGEHLDGKAFARLWPALLDRPAIRRVIGTSAEPEGPHRAWPIPAGVDRATLAAGRALFVGDAARAADVMTGEGIGQALLTGRVAAEALAADGPGHHPSLTASRYATRVRDELGPDHRMATWLTRVLAHPRSADLAIAAVGASPWNRRQFARWLFEDSPRGLALTPRRWGRGALSGPGGYVGVRTGGRRVGPGPHG